MARAFAAAARLTRTFAKNPNEHLNPNERKPTSPRMNVRSFALAFVSMAGTLAAGSVSAFEEGPQKPNIVFILADDLGYGDVSAYDSRSKAPTPHMDALARQGMRFTDAHSPASVCSPTRYAVLTGRFAWRTRLKLGVLNPWDKALIEPDRLTVGQMLKQQGYTTAAFGKWHLGWTWSTLGGVPQEPGKGQEYKSLIDLKRPIADGPTTRGFDTFFGMVGMTPGEPCLIADDRPIFDGKGRAPEIAGVSREILDDWKDENTPELLSQKVTHYLETRAADPDRKPFFLYYALTTPHQPIIPAKDFRGKTGYGEACDFVHETDHYIGQVLKALDRLDMARNTLVIISSDNGSPGYAEAESPTASVMDRYGHFPSGPFRGMKGDAFEGGHRVPLIARWPGRIPANAVSDEVVCLVDLMATFAKITGAKLPENAAEDSYDITAALTGEATKPIREATVHHALIGMFAIRQGRWKLIEGLGSGGFTMPQHIPLKPAPEGKNGVGGYLFDMGNDPGETRNLYREHPEIVERLSALLNRYRESGRSVNRGQ